MQAHAIDQADYFRHLGGGRKGILLLLRYVYILAAAYLLLGIGF